MGLFEDIGTLVGGVVGGVIGGAVSLAGEVTDSKFLKEVGEGVFEVSKKSGQLVGSFADGTVDCVAGVITDDKQQASKGFEQMVDVAGETVVGVGRGVVNVAGKGIETVGAILDGNEDKALEVGKDLVKTLAIGALAVGVVDIIDGVDGFDEVDVVDTGHDVGGINHVALISDTDDTSIIDTSTGADHILIENDNMHHVTPHFRTLPDGTEIWVDGDGDTSVNTNDGWTQHNPDFRKPI